MKSFNGFKAAIKRFILVLIACMNVIFVQGSFLETFVDEVVPKAVILFYGWTTLSVGAFIGKKVFTNLSEKHPLKKDYYLKMAKIARNTSRFSAIPLVSGTLGLAIGTICWPLAYKCSPESSVGNVLGVVPQIVLLPAQAMTLLPAALSSKGLR